MNLVRYHKRGVETQAEVSDNLVIVGLVLVLLHEIRGAGKSDLVDVLVHLLGGHAQTIVMKGDGLGFGVYDHVNSGLVIHGELVLAHHVQLL